MSRISHVDRLYPTPDPKYPAFRPDHPRNRHIDWMPFIEMEDGGSPAPSTEFYVKARGRMDAVWLSGIATPLVSVDLKVVLEGAAGADLGFLPMTVNGTPYWLLRVVTCIDALDEATSEYFRGPRGNIKLIERAVWDPSRLTDPHMFTIPQQPRSVWATPGVASAYRESGCTGLNFAPYGEVL